MIYQIQRTSRSTNGELAYFFTDLLAGIIPTKSGYSRARQKLNSSCYDALSQLVYSTLEINEHWKGHQVKGVDGSTARLPYSAKCIERYGSYDAGKSSSSKQVCMGRISLFYDVLHKQIISSRLDEYRCSEKAQFESFVSHIDSNDVLLMDSNYAKKTILEAILERNGHFVVPLTEQRHVVRRFLRNRKRKDEVTTIGFTDSSSKESLEITGRLIKKEIDGNCQVLFTSLSDQTEYKASDLFDLYTKRWQLETCFQQLKNTLELANWTGASPLAIDQDFKANIFLYNLTSALTHKVKPNRRTKAKRGKTKRKRTINFSYAMCRCKLLVKQLLVGSSILIGIQQFLTDVKRCIEYSRKGQKQPRNYWNGKTYFLNQKHA